MKKYNKPIDKNMDKNSESSSIKNEGELTKNIEIKKHIFLRGIPNTWRLFCPHTLK